MTQEEIDRLQVENARLREQLREQQKFDRLDYVEKLISDGFILPRSRNQANELLSYAEAYDYGEPLDFNEGENLTDKVKALLESLPQFDFTTPIASKAKAVEKEQFSEKYTANLPFEIVEIDQKIKTYMKANNVDYRTAFKIVLDKE